MKEERAMAEVSCPLCGRDMTLEDREAREDIAGKYEFAAGSCRACGLMITVPAGSTERLARALGSKGTVSVQSIQRQEAVDEKGMPASANHAIVTTDGPVLEALVDLDEIEKMVPGRSPLGALEDCVRIVVRAAEG